MSAVIANCESHLQQTVDCLSTVIGDTPMLAVHYRYRGEPRCIYAKAEYFNLTGSIKGRMVLHILRKAYAQGDLRDGDCKRSCRPS